MDINTLNEWLMEKMKNSEYNGRRAVLGRGKDKGPSLALVGEAPGAKEEASGEPFVGSAGKNLDEFLNILGTNREEIYITNAVKIRPFKLSKKTGKPVNRPPSQGEIDFFKAFLLKEIEIVEPEIIVTLGNIPLKAILGEPSIGQSHGKITEFGGFALFPLYHPAAVIYNRSLKDTYLKDLYVLREIIQKRR